MKTRMSLDSGFHTGMFMRAIIIHDQMEIEFGRSYVVDSLKESDELLMPMAGHAISDHLAVEHAEGGKQGGRSMAAVIMRRCSTAAFLQGQTGLGSIQRLDLAFFVNTQNQGLVPGWYLIDEEYSHSHAALALLDKYISYELEIFAPSLLAYEVLNGLLIARKRGRIEQEMAITAVEGFLGLDIDRKDISSFYPKIMHFSETYSLSAYDASYLAVADEEGVVLVTADENLYDKVRKHLKWVLWLGG